MLETINPPRLDEDLDEIPDTTPYSREPPACSLLCGDTDRCPVSVEVHSCRECGSVVSSSRVPVVRGIDGAGRDMREVYSYALGILTALVCVGVGFLGAWIQSR